MTVLYLDIETDGDPWTGRLLVACWAVDDGPVRTDVGGLSMALSMALAGGHTIVEQSKYDARWLRRNGNVVKGTVHDTMTLGWALDENQPLDLEHMVRRYLGRNMDKRLSRNKNVVRFRRDDGKYVPIGEAPIDQLSEYCRRDVEDMRDLYLDLLDRIAGLPDVFERWQKNTVPYTQLLLDMECRGVPVDVEEALVLGARFRHERKQLHMNLLTDAGLPDCFNLNSGDQVAAYLFLESFELKDRVPIDCPAPDGFTVTKEGRKWKYGTWKVDGLRMPVRGKWTKPKPGEERGRPIVDAPTLMIHYAKNEWVQAYLEYKELDKLVGTYLEPFVEKSHGGRLYANFNQTSTVTGRLSSSEPNLQNVPARGRHGKLIRGLFKGDLVVADYSQLEPRLMAHYSQDPKLLDVFHSGRDVYRVLGMDVFSCSYDDVTGDQRNICKELLLAMGYGALGKKIAERISLRGYPTSWTEANQYLATMMQSYPVFWDWKQTTIGQAMATGFVTTISGRQRHVEGVGSEDWNTHTHGERQAVNSVIQGSAADVVEVTMLGCDQQLPELPILLQIHDEVVWEVPDGVEPDLGTIQMIGENPPWELSVPLVFEPRRVSSWADK